MKTRKAISILFSFALSISIPVAGQENSTKVASQNPSPMIEGVRKHERIQQKDYPGIAFKIRDFFAKPLQVFVPQRSIRAKTFDLLIHFHGAPFVVHHAAVQHRGTLIAATLSVGSGSQVYDDAFQDTTKFKFLIDIIVTKTKAHLTHDFKLRRVILSGFSAGYGAIRKIISTESNYAAVDAVLLLDGIHAGYIPDRKVLAEGGRIDSTDLLPFAKFAQDAASSVLRKRFLITHSEIFPGTFVSTTESTDFLLRSLSIRRVPVLRWGPLGMQQISSAYKNHFAVLGFAGNTAPDHIDHYHGLYWFLNELLKL